MDFALGLISGYVFSNIIQPKQKGGDPEGFCKFDYKWYKFQTTDMGKTRLSDNLKTCSECQTELNEKRTQKCNTRKTVKLKKECEEKFKCVKSDIQPESKGIEKVLRDETNRKRNKEFQECKSKGIRYDNCAAHM